MIGFIDWYIPPKSGLYMRLGAHLNLFKYLFVQNVNGNKIR